VPAQAQLVLEPSADVDVEMPTRLFQPPPELVAASAPEREREPSLPEAYRSRRMMVAIILVLVGCAVGLLFARQPSAPTAPPLAPVPAAPANP
jgi:hypothetical protein